MKNKILYIIASVMLTGFTSCSDFLDRYPTEELSDGSFWKTKTDAEMAVSDIYRCLPTWDIDEDINSDNAVHGISGLMETCPKAYTTLLTKDGQGITDIFVDVIWYYRN